MSRPRPPAPHVVIIGGGYAGVLAANRVAGRAGRGVRVTLISDRDELVHRIRLHEAAAGTRSRRYPLRGLLHRRVELRQGRVDRIDAAARACVVAGDAIAYDHLIVAVGSGIAAGVPGARDHGGALGDPDAAAAFAARLAALPDGAAVAVIGGGLSAIETAAEIAEAHPALRVALVADRVLPAWDDAGRAAIRDGLRALGVDVVRGARVVEVTATAIRLAGGEQLAADATVWAAGFTVAPLARASGLPVDDHGRLRVDATLRVPGHPEIVGAGDAVATPGSVLGRGAGADGAIRMGCASAMPQGAHAADTVLAALRGEAPRPMHFGFVLQCVSLGRHRGVAMFVDGDDRPTGRIITGRTGALIKELICQLVIGGLRVERRLPGTYTWPQRRRRPPALVAAPPPALPPG
ncbi:MAG: FAD-dependent oxidoreductase [Kofleriaceae bacterium]|nr:FAD-dependent oxidoreductase [Kofleriaceae bacterium]